MQSGEADIERCLPSPAPAVPKKGEPLPEDVDEGLYETLRAWRRGLAEEENVPPYVIFADKVLLALAARKPANEFELLEIPGIGPAKAAKFGRKVLDMIEESR